MVKSILKSKSISYQEPLHIRNDWLEHSPIMTKSCMWPDVHDDYAAPSTPEHDDAFLSLNAHDQSLIPLRTAAKDPCSHTTNNYTQNSSTKKALGVFIPADLKSGRKVKIRYPDGKMIRIKVPPQSEWKYKNSSTSISPQAYFLVPV